MKLRIRCVLGAVVLLSSCDPGATPGAEGTAGAVRGEVRYPGSVQAPLRIAVFPSFPPRGAPIAVEEISAPRFPQAFALKNVPAGRYFILAILDVDAADGDRFRPARDPGGAFGGFLSPAAVTVEHTGAEGVVIDLVDPSPDSPWARSSDR